MSWTDWHWQFVLAAVLIGGLLTLLATSVWKSITQRETSFEVSAQQLLSVQKADKGKDDAKPRTVLLSDIEGIESANENWIHFVLNDQPHPAEIEQHDRFDLDVGMLWPTERYHVCRILSESGFTDVTKETKSWCFKAPRFSIMNVFALTTFVAAMAMVNRWAMVEWETTRTAAALTTAMATFAVGLLTVLGGAIWVAATDSSSAHRCVLVGGLLILASFPAAFLFPLIYNAPEIIRGLPIALAHMNPIAIIILALAPVFILKTVYDRFV